MNPDPNAYRPSSLDLEDAARMKSESELESTQARAVKTMREYHETVSILENELDANDYQNIMGRPHPWKIL